LLRRLCGASTELTLAPGGADARIKADQGQVEQVILNLAVNARDAMPEGGRLAIETGEMTLDDAFAEAHRGARPGPYVFLRVRDTGVGMDSETCARAFEPYFTTKEGSGGTGLGLTTVYGILKQTGGYVWMESEPRQGTTITAYWPAVPSEPASVEAAAEKAAATDGPETVLVVEDEESLRNLAREYLQSTGYHVLLASNGAEALAIADKQRGPIHLLLTDVVMPRLSGNTLAERVLGQRPKTRVLFMSGFTDSALVRHGITSGEVDCLLKPFTANTLLQKVREVLDRGSASAVEAKLAEASSPDADTEQLVNTKRMGRGPVRLACRKGLISLGANLAEAVVSVCPEEQSGLPLPRIDKGQDVELVVRQTPDGPVRQPAQLLWVIPQPDGCYRVGLRFRRRVNLAELQPSG
jgi:DNA-binding response OmpR family regulator